MPPCRGESINLSTPRRKRKSPERGCYSAAARLFGLTNSIKSLISVSVILPGLSVFADLGDRRDLGRRTRDEAFGEVPSSSGMIARSITSMPRALARPMTVRRVMPSRKQSGVGRVDHAVLDQENIGASALRYTAATIEHQGIGIAGALGAMFLDRADHIEPRRLGFRRRTRRIRPAIFRQT